MRPISAYLHLMTQTLTVYPFSGYDRYSKPIYGAAITYPCRLVGVKHRGGKEQQSGWTAYLGTPDYVTPLSMVVLSTADVNSTEPVFTSPPIKSSVRFSGSDGWHHTVLHL